MNRERLKALLREVQSGSLEIESAVEKLKGLPFEDIGFAKVDHHRSVRRGFPEVILGLGKTAEQVVEIAERLFAQNDAVLITRLSDETANLLSIKFPETQYHAVAHLAALLRRGVRLREYGDLIVMSAGTADLPVAEEAALTAAYMGNRVTRVYDVGISGLHRLLAERERLAQARVVVVVAGMDAALAAVVGGLIETPVIAVPTSVGYGTALGGIAPLLTMLNSCSSGVGVVNIDNGFGGAYLASLINQIDRRDEE